MFLFYVNIYRYMYDYIGVETPYILVYVYHIYACIVLMYVYDYSTTWNLFAVPKNDSLCDHFKLFLYDVSDLSLCGHILFMNVFITL